MSKLSTIQVWMCDSCEKTEFGCCVDLENAALGPNFDGCPAKNGTGGGYKDCTLTVSSSIAALKCSTYNDQIRFLQHSQT